MSSLRSKRIFVTEHDTVSFLLGISFFYFFLSFFFFGHCHKYEIFLLTIPSRRFALHNLYTTWIFEIRVRILLLSDF